MENSFSQGLDKIFTERAKALENQEHPGEFDILDAFMRMVSPEDYLPESDYNGFTATEIHQMVLNPLGERGPVKLRELSEEEICKIPFMRQTLHLMNALNQKELKLTAKGNLPTKMVSELYELGAHSMNSDWYTNKTEDNIFEVQFFRAILKTLGLIKVRTGKLSLTATGKKLISDDHNKLLRTIIMFFFTQYNTGWYDARENYNIGNRGRVYSLWLLHHYGEEWCSMRFLSDEYFKAFPELKPDDSDDSENTRLYKSRVFRHLFVIIGLAEINEDIPYGAENWGDLVRKTPVLDMMFSFKEPEKME